MPPPARETGPRPTMRHVARAAGVSPMTVSYVYSRPGRVAAETVERVRAAARELGYAGPDPTARSLRRGRVGTLGVVLAERLSYAFDDPQAARFLAGIADVCVAEGVGLTLLPVTGSPSDVDRVAEAVVDGLVVWTTGEDDPVLDAVADRGLPAVVHAGPAHRGMPVVGIDDRAAATAVGRVAFAGARRPVVLGFPVDRHRERLLVAGSDVGEMPFPVTRARWAGYRDAWTGSGADPADLRLAVCPVNDAGEGEAFTAELLAADDPPDAIAAMSDELAFGALRAAAAVGVGVPADLAVTGWDDGDAAAAAGLTTVSQSLREQGARCARIALGGSAPESPPAWQVVVRTTTRRRGGDPSA